MKYLQFLQTLKLEILLPGQNTTKHSENTHQRGNNISLH